MSGTHQDITERKNFETQLLQAKRLADEANLAKSEFLSRMSHELRTPMNSILGFAQLMEMGDLTPKQRKGIGHILNNGRHLLSLINEVLDISGIEAGKESMSIEPVNLKSLLLDLIDLNQIMADKKKVTILLETHISGNLYVQADNRRLRQVLLNFLNNAIKYNIPGGTVMIETQISRIQLSNQPGVKIVIRDSGPGIKPEHLSRLFQPFERIGAESSDIEGTGLGLMVAKRLTEAMGGSVGVESEVGSGSAFWVELPKSECFPADSVQAEDGNPAGAPAIGSAVTILYIEDNLSNIELVEEIIALQRPALQLTTAITGSDGLRSARKIMPSLILLDLNLPDISGFDVLESILADEQTKDIPVVVISADAIPHRIDRLLQAGAADYLTKPLDVAQFLSVIDKHIELKQV